MFTERRSIRRFQDKEIATETVDAIIEAARWAPSWANTQCCEMIMVQDAAKKKALSELVSSKNPGTLAVANAPVVFVMLGKLGTAGFYNNKAITTLGDWFMYDVGLASENICMAAHEKGLGTVIIGAFDHAGVASLLQVPESHAVVAIIPMGYPDQAPPAPKRKSAEALVHRESF